MKFTINLYHTTCRILVNGKAHEDFVEKDLPDLIQLAMRKLPDATFPNTSYRKALEQFRSVASGKTKRQYSTGPDKHNTDNEPATLQAKYRKLTDSVDYSSTQQTDKYPGNKSRSRTQEDSPSPVQQAGETSEMCDSSLDISPGQSSCTSCNKKDSEEMIACDRCEGWYHYSCESINKDHALNLQSTDTEYICLGCRAGNDDNADGEGDNHAGQGARPKASAPTVSTIPDVPPLQINDNAEAEGDNHSGQGARPKASAPPVLKIPDVSPLQINDSGCTVRRRGRPPKSTSTSKVTKNDTTGNSNHPPPDANDLNQETAKTKTSKSSKVLTDPSSAVQRMERENKELKDKLL